MQEQIVSPSSLISEAQVWQALATEWKSLAEKSEAPVAKKPARRRKPTPRKIA